MLPHLLQPFILECCASSVAFCCPTLSHHHRTLVACLGKRLAHLREDWVYHCHMPRSFLVCQSSIWQKSFALLYLRLSSWNASSPPWTIQFRRLGEWSLGIYDLCRSSNSLGTRDPLSHLHSLMIVEIFCFQPKARLPSCSIASMKWLDLLGWSCHQRR